MRAVTFLLFLRITVDDAGLRDYVTPKSLEVPKSRVKEERNNKHQKHQ